MGKYRFKLSDMIPNAWFYKLKDMGKSRSTSLKSRNPNRVKQFHTPTQTTSKGPKITQFQPPKSSSAYYPSSASPAEPLIRFNDPLYSSPRSHGRPSNDCSYTSPRRSKRTTIYKQTNETICSSDQPFCHSLSSSELDSPEFIMSKSNPRSRRSIEFLMFHELGSWSSSSLRSSCRCSCRISSSTADIIMDLKYHHNKNHEDSISRKFQKLNEFDAVSELELKPIQTKIPKEQNFGKSNNKMIRQSAGKELHAIDHYNSKFVTNVKKSRRSSSLLSEVELRPILTKIPKEQNFGKSNNKMIRQSAGKELHAIDHYNSKFVTKVKKSPRSSSLLSRVELRPILTKIPKEHNFGKSDNKVIRKSAGTELHAVAHNNSKFVRQVKKSRRSSSLLLDSFVIIKSSLDPQRDFQDSMMEMIEENNIRGFKDLEELLACYLILNCKEYHPLIVKAFEQIWLDIF